MTITQLEYVLAVNKFRHFGKAAKHCHVTQPTLSMQLQKLEEELDIIVYDRSKNPIIPTREGEALIAQAKIVIKENRKILEVIQQEKMKLNGTFNLGVIPTLAPYIIPLFADHFSKKYPEIQLIIEECKTEDIISLLDEDELDGGLLVTPLHNDSLIERVLYYEPFYLFIDDMMPLAKKKKIRQADLSLKEIWMLNKGNCFRDQVLNICNDREQLNNLNDNLHFESGNFETLKNMVVRSSGYTILPHMAVGQLAPAQRKMVREFTNPVPTREVSLVYGRTFLKERIIDALEDVIISVVPKDLKTLKGRELEIVEIYPEDK